MLYCFKNAIDVRVTWAPYEYILRLKLFNMQASEEKKTPPDKTSFTAGLKENFCFNIKYQL